jgi:hypothetical protein
VQRLVRRRAALQEPPDLLDAAAFTAQMNDGMAVGTYRPHIGNRFHLVLRANRRQRLHVVDVNEPFGERPIHGAEVEAAYHA